MFAKNCIKQNYSALNYGSHVARTHVQSVTMHAMMVQVFKKYFGTFGQTGCLNEVPKRLADNKPVHRFAYFDSRKTYFTTNNISNLKRIKFVHKHLNKNVFTWNFVEMPSLTETANSTFQNAYTIGYCTRGSWLP